MCCGLQILYYVREGIFLNVFDITIKLVIGFMLLFIVTKAIGKTQLNQISPFDFISAMVMGELLGNAIYDKEVSLLFVCYTLFIWTILMLIIEKVSLRYLISRDLLNGNPDIIIRNGVIDREIMKKNKIDINTLLELLRKKDIFAVRDVEYGILEPSGTLSVLKKSRAQEIKKSDLDLPVKAVNLPTILIIDGTVLFDNLDGAGLNINWLKKEIEKKGYSSIKDIFYAEWEEEQGLLLQVYND